MLTGAAFELRRAIYYLVMMLYRLKTTYASLFVDLLSDYIPVATIPETAFALDANPRVVEVNVSPTMMQINCIYALGMSAFSVNRNRTACP